jgi:hypothetical protein
MWIRVCTWIYLLKITTTQITITGNTLVLVVSSTCLWTRSSFCLPFRSSFLWSVCFLHGLSTRCRNWTLFMSYPSYVTPGYPNGKHRLSDCWGLPFLAVMQPYGAAGELNVSMEVCFTSHCLATMAVSRNISHSYIIIYGMRRQHNTIPEFQKFT